MDYTVLSNQTDLHKDLEKLVRKHVAHPFQKPTPPLQQQIFIELDNLIQQNTSPIILDFGCGTGLSSQNFATIYPDHLIVGIDKSIYRLNKHNVWKNHPISRYLAQHDNLVLVQANIMDLIPLIAKAGWNTEKQYHFYPNPWPKSEQFKRRLHGHPIFSDLLSLSSYIEIRSNWRVYLQEFLLATKYINSHWSGQVKVLKSNSTPMTLFEKKYWQSSEATYQLILQL